MMYKNEIGNNAGRIWTLLSEQPEMPVTTLKRRAELADKELYLALGWLSRENKIMFFEKANKLFVCLTEVM